MHELIKDADRPRVLMFVPALAPYRVSIYNEIGSTFNLKIILLSDNLLNQKFDQSSLLGRLNVNYKYLINGFDFMRRRIRFGFNLEIIKFQPDVVMTCEFSPATIAVAFHKVISRGPYKHLIWTDDNPDSLARDSIFRKIIRRAIMPFIDGFVFVSHEAADYYSSRYGLKVPSAVVPIIQSESETRDGLADSEDMALRLVTEYDLLDKRVLLFVGRLAEEKSIDRLIGAFAMVAARMTDVILVLVGEGNARVSLAGLVVKLGLTERVFFAGRHEGDRLAAWYRIGGVFALTSEFEPFGAVVNEALIAGMPVVCSNKAGAKSLIRSGWNGTVVDPANCAALEDALLYWLEHCPPISIGSITALRESLMPIRFQDAVDSYINIINIVSGAGTHDHSR